jgi:hypothetical protein
MLTETPTVLVLYLMGESTFFPFRLLSSSGVLTPPVCELTLEKN